MARVTVIGSGFGGLAAVRALRRRVPGAAITIVAPREEFIYYPSLVGVPVGDRDASDARIALNDFVERYDVTFVTASVTGLAHQGRTVVTDHGEIDNDVLIIASGGESLRTLPGLEYTLAICDGVEAAQEIGDRVAALRRGTIAFGFAGNPAEPQAVRGGPVFELLLSIDTYLRRAGRRDAIDLVFFNPSLEPGNRLGPRAVTGVMKEMESRAIRSHLGHKILGFAADRVILDDGDLAADLILFVPGMSGPRWARETDLALSPGGFIRADRSCRVFAHPGVFVVGDAGAYEGTADWMPKQGHAAELQAATAAVNVAHFLAGEPPTATFRQELICIIDTLDSGIMVYRSPRFAGALPSPAWRVVKHGLESRSRHAYGASRGHRRARAAR
ncbi:MAG: NAD(P)/FAD-dependent oxidoreductase [Acidimicrobiales bacterium]